jgi:cytochrome c biogenesis protein CcmG, thiol:disulfide interchange protein DsbE
MRKSRVFWVLVGLTVITVALGLWRWQGSRREAAQRLAEQSKSSLQGASQSRAPDFALEGLDGKTLRLADLRGKVVLLNFWATWCPPCKAEMPDLNALQREYGAAQDFVVVGVNVEEDAATVKPFVEKNGLSFPIVLDRDSRITTQLFGVRPLPTTFIIDREGYIRDAWNGQISREAMLARLKRVW